MHKLIELYLCFALEMRDISVSKKISSSHTSHTHAHAHANTYTHRVNHTTQSKTKTKTKKSNKTNVTPQIAPLSFSFFFFFSPSPCPRPPLTFHAQPFDPSLSLYRSHTRPIDNNHAHLSLLRRAAGAIHLSTLTMQVFFPPSNPLFH